MITLPIVISILFGASVALGESRNARILRFDNDNIGTGSYKFGFESSDGITREEEGNLVHQNEEHEHIVVKGSYSYTGPDGIVYTVRYTADDNGFHPEGDHFKVPPFVPWVHHHQEDQTQDLTRKINYDDSFKSTTSPVYLPSTPAPFPNTISTSAQRYLPTSPESVSIGTSTINPLPSSTTLPPPLANNVEIINRSKQRSIPTKSLQEEQAKPSNRIPVYNIQQLLGGLLS